MGHHAKESRTWPHIQKQLLVVVLLSAVAIFIAILFGNNFGHAAFTSAEVKFTDASAHGMDIVPASCPSDPTSGDTPNGCDGSIPKCSDGADAPGGNLANCPTGSNPLTCDGAPHSITVVGLADYTVPTGVTSVHALVVGGGGGGGSGGGGAGGFIENASYSVTAGATIRITVGAGGRGGNVFDPGGDGQLSQFDALIAAGGGSSSSDTGSGDNGGSGGGGYIAAGSATPSGQGNDGGLGIAAAPGGGGGAGAPGGSPQSGRNGGVGGAGKVASINGVTYAGGGGGSGSAGCSVASGGSGGGGAGSCLPTLAVSGTQNKGGGGGGGPNPVNSVAGDGGSGIVIYSCSAATAPGAPTNPQVLCNANGTQATFSWGAGSGATSYFLAADYLLNDTAAPSCAAGWGWYCAAPPDFYTNTVNSTSYTLNVTPNGRYQWLVWSQNSVGSSGNPGWFSPSFVCSPSSCSPNGTLTCSGNNIVDSCGTPTPCTGGRQCVASSGTAQCVCPAGQIWNGTACVANPCPPPKTWNGTACVNSCPPEYICTNGNLNFQNPDCSLTPGNPATCPFGCNSAGNACRATSAVGDIVAVPSVVQKNHPTQVSWAAQGVSSCKVLGSNGNVWGCSGGPACEATTTKQSSDITSQVIFRLTCTANDGSTLRDQATVNIIPTFCEPGQVGC